MVRQSSSYSEESPFTAKKPPAEDAGNPSGERFNPFTFFPPGWKLAIHAGLSGCYPHARRWLKQKASQRLVVVINLSFNSGLIEAPTANVSKENLDCFWADGQDTPAARGLRHYLQLKALPPAGRCRRRAVKLGRPAKLLQRQDACVALREFLERATACVLNDLPYFLKEGL